MTALHQEELGLQQGHSSWQAWLTSCCSGLHGPSSGPGQEMNLGNTEKEGKGLWIKTSRIPSQSSSVIEDSQTARRKLALGRFICSATLPSEMPGHRWSPPAAQIGPGSRAGLRLASEEKATEASDASQGQGVSRCPLPQGTHTMPSKPCRPHFLPATWQPNLSASCMLFPGQRDEWLGQPGLRGRGRPQPCASC